MSNIVILGNGLPALHVAKALKQKGHQGDVAVFCPEGVLPYDRQLLARLLGKNIKESVLFAEANAVMAEYGVKFITKETLTRLSVKRHHLVTANKTNINYDHLILTDIGQFKLPSIKGLHRKGVYDAVRFTSVKEMSAHLLNVDHAIVEVNSFLGFNIACVLAGLNKEVIMVTSQKYLLEEKLDEEAASLLKQIIETKGVRVMTGTTIEEVLGDHDVKAVRLSPGKVIACELVVFDHVSADVKILNEAEIFFEGVLRVEGNRQLIAVNNVLLGVELTGYLDLTTQESLNEGNYLAAQVLGVSFDQTAVLTNREFGSSLIKGFLTGNTKLLEGGREYMSFDGPSNIFKKMYLNGDYIVGGIAFNAPSFETKLMQAMANAQPITGQEEPFLHEHV